MGNIYKDEQTKTKRIIITDNIKDLIYAKSNGKCFYCGKSLSREEFSVEHIIPLALGGKNEVNNMVCACKKCNTKKGNNILFKHILSMENFIQEQSEIISGKKELINKINSLLGEEKGKRQQKEEQREINAGIKEKDIEILALKKERAKILKDLNKLKENFDKLSEQKADKVREELKGVREAYKILSDDYKVLKDELEEQKKKAKIVITNKEYELKIKDLEKKASIDKGEIDKRDREIKRLEKEVSDQKAIVCRLKRKEEAKVRKEQLKKQEIKNKHILDEINKVKQERNKQFNQIFSKKGKRKF